MGYNVSLLVGGISSCSAPVSRAASLKPLQAAVARIKNVCNGSRGEASGQCSTVVRLLLSAFFLFFLFNCIECISCGHLHFPLAARSDAGLHILASSDREAGAGLAWLLRSVSGRRPSYRRWRSSATTRSQLCLRSIELAQTQRHCDCSEICTAKHV